MRVNWGALRTGARVRARTSDEDGFTLLELVVVVLIVGILLGIAVPSMVGARERASNRAAEMSVRTAGKAAFVYVVQSGAFADTPAALASFNQIEPDLTFVGGATASTDPKTVSVSEDAAGLELAIAAQARTGRCVYLRVSLDTQEMRHSDTPGACRAADYEDGPNTGW